MSPYFCMAQEIWWKPDELNLDNLMVWYTTSGDLKYISEKLHFLLCQNVQMFRSFWDIYQWYSLLDDSLGCNRALL